MRSTILLILSAALADFALGAQLTAIIRPVTVSSTPSSTPGGANDSSLAPALTPDGRFVAFHSLATDLTTNRIQSDRFGAFINVFLHDRLAHQTSLVSAVPSGDRSGTGNSYNAEVTPDGKYVLFESEAGDLTPNDTNAVTDVFLRDVAAGATTLVSVANGGPQSGNGPSGNATMTPDGRYVVFESAASDLVAGDTNNIPDIFVRDMQTGTLEWVTAGAQPLLASVSTSGSATISSNGQRVAFSSTASNLVSGTASPTGEIFVRDLTSKVTLWAARQARALSGQTNAMVNCDPVICGNGRYAIFKSTPIIGTLLQPNNGLIIRYDVDADSAELIATNALPNTFPDDDSSAPVVSADGRFVAYEALVPGAPSATTLYRWDGLTKTPLLISSDLAGLAPTNGFSSLPTMTEDGRFITFLSSSGNLVTNNIAGETQLYLRDVDLGITWLISVDASGAGTADTLFEPAPVSADGAVVTFSSENPDGVGGAEGGVYQVYARDVPIEQTQLLTASEQSLSSVTADGWSTPGALSQDGGRVVFESMADNLVAGDTNGLQDVFLRDLRSGTNLLVSISMTGSSANAPSSDPVLSADGRYVAFYSLATNLAEGDTNTLEDLYLRDTASGITELVSQAADHTAVSVETTSRPSLSLDGRSIVFESRAAALVPGKSGTLPDLFWRDLAAGQTVRITQNQLYGWWVASPDAHSVVYESAGLALWDAGTRATRIIATNRVSAGMFSPDGNTFFYFLRGVSGNELHALQLASAQDEFIGLASWAGSHPTVASSADGRWVAYVSGLLPVSADDTNGTTDVVLYDRQQHHTTVVSRKRSGTGTGNGASDWPLLSADGRRLAFRSYASDLVENDSNQASDIFVYDRDTGPLAVLSRNLQGVPASGFSSAPLMSADGSVVVFASSADDLVPGDYNTIGDIFWAALPPLLTAPLLQNVTRSPEGALTFSWPATAGTTYQVQYLDDISSSAWVMSPQPVTIAGGMARFTESPVLDRQRFYRVVGTMP